jgi:Fe-S cluster assembly protein SufD
MATLTQAKFDRPGFEAFRDARDEPAWLKQARTQHWDRFEAMGWPNPRSEEWLRTDLRMFKLDRYSLPIESGDQPTWTDDASGTLLSFGVELAGQLVTFDSQPQACSLQADTAAKGVVFSSLEQAAADHPELVQRYLFTQALDPTVDRFATLHAACWSGGHFVFVPRGVSIDRPLHIAARLSDGATDLGHTLIILEEGASATVLYESCGATPQSGGLHVGGVEIIQQAGSQLRYVNVQDWGHATYHFAHQRAIVQRDASLQWTVVALGSQLAKVNQQVALTGAGAHSQVNGVLFTEGRQHLAYNTLQHHQAPHCTSDFLYKAALQDKSRTVWRGMIRVDRDAQRTDGYQRNDNLLLSEHARSDSIPGLEIEADDVRCTHGSTTSQVDEEMIFYALCRGLSRREATRMIVSGFFQKIFDRITIDSVRQALTEAIGHRVREC